MNNVKTFDSFFEEQSLTESKKINQKKEYTLSNKVQDSIKKLCESHLDKEAKAHDQDETKATYEGYMKEAVNHMKNCVNECMEVYRASGDSSAGMK